MFGIFSITKISNTEIDNLMVSLTETKLNYPGKLFSILTANNDDYLHKKEFEKKFDKIIPKNDFLNSQSIFREKKSDKKISTLKGVQKKYNEQIASVYTKNMAYISSKSTWSSDLNFNIGDLSKAQYLDWFDQTINRTVRTNIYQYDDLFVGQKKLDNKKSDLKDIVPYHKFAMLNDFIIDNNSIEFGEITTKIIDVDKQPSTSYDPFKPIRILSASGWHISNQETIDSFISKTYLKD